MRKLLVLLALALGLAVPASSQAPPPVPALPDTPRVTTYSLSSSTCVCSVGFALYGDNSDVDEWVQVFVGSTAYLSTDPTFGWSLSSVSGQLATLPRPITNAVLTFNSPQTATVTIVGARRPRRLSQFPENRGVAARDLNQVITDQIAAMREAWDLGKRSIVVQPGEVLNVLPPAATRAGAILMFDGAGQPIVGSPGAGTGNVTGPLSSVNNDVACWNGTTGALLKDCGSIGTTTLTGDVIGGPSVGTVATTLANTAVTPGTYGSTSNSLQLTVDSKGRLTGVSNQPVTPGSIGAVPTSRQIIGGTGVSVAGGPTLAADLTLNLSTISNNNTLCNISGIPGSPGPCTLTALIDAAIGATQGNVLFRSAAQWVVLAPGAAGQLLTSGGTAADVSWSTATGTGTVTSITPGTGITLTPNPITATGSVALTVPVVVSSGGTGDTTLTNHALLLGKGTAAVGNTGAGTTGQCAVSNGAAADPTFTSGCRVLLATLTASNSTTLSDITHITSAYNEYELVFENIVPVTDAVNCQIQVHSGGAFKVTLYVARGMANGTTGSAQTTNIPCSATGAATVSGVSNSGFGISGTFRIYLPSSTTIPAAVRGSFFYTSAAGATSEVGDAGGIWNSTGAAIDGFQVNFSSGNISTGVIKVYGLL